MKHDLSTRSGLAAHALQAGMDSMHFARAEEIDPITYHEFIERPQALMVTATSDDAVLIVCMEPDGQDKITLPVSRPDQYEAEEDEAPFGAAFFPISPRAISSQSRDVKIVALFGPGSL